MKKKNFKSERVLELALREASMLSHENVGPEHILLGILRDADNLAAKLLKDLYDLDHAKFKKLLKKISNVSAEDEEKTFPRWWETVPVVDPSWRDGE